MTANAFAKKARSFEAVAEQPHFEKRSFRVRNKIFATLDEGNNRFSVKLSEAEQSVFCSFNKEQIVAATGAWGKQGWTVADLKKLPSQVIGEMLQSAYCNVAPEKLAIKYRAL